VVAALIDERESVLKVHLIRRDAKLALMRTFVRRRILPHHDTIGKVKKV
jgi:hypothetical protein